jgi:hypothetical protein
MICLICSVRSFSSPGLAFCPSKGRLFGTSAHPGLELLGGFICFAINTILWMLAALFFIFLLWVTDLAIGWALRVPSYLRISCTNFWQK